MIDIFDEAKIWVRLITNKYGCYINLSLCNIHAFYLKLIVLILDNIPSESVLNRMIITMPATELKAMSCRGRPMCLLRILSSFCCPQYLALASRRAGQTFYGETGGLKHATDDAFGTIGGEDTAG